MTIAPDQEFSLSDRYTTESGDILVTGIQALVRLPFDQMRADRRAGLRTAAFVSGYQGSPLGGFDRELISRPDLQKEYGVVHRPGLNEELAATSVAGSQLVSTLKTATYDGVAGYWYGKTPGLDRAADAIRHGVFAGTSRHGGVLALVGDDPACKSSTLPSRADALVTAIGMPFLDPGTMQDVLDLGRHGIEMSRVSGLWSAFKIVTSVADGSGLATVSPDRVRPIVPVLEINGKPWTPTLSGFTTVPTSLQQEAEMMGPRIEMALRYLVENRINTNVIESPSPWLGIVASGANAEAVLAALATLGLDEERASALGIRLLKLRAVYPFDVEAIRRLAKGVKTLLVVEEKRNVIEMLVRDTLYSSVERPVVIGKKDANGASLVTDLGALTASVLVEPLRRVLTTTINADLLRPAREKKSIALTVRSDAVRTPYFCSGCPHNTSTVVPEGSLVGMGIGCHGMVASVGREDRGELISITQMGGEGTHWIGMAPFTSTEHIFQNLGDGTFFHSGQLAVQAAIASGVTMTYKILYNAAVAMTGGQDATGLLPVPQVAAKLMAEGVKEVVITTDEPEKYKGVSLGHGVSVKHRDELLKVQERLRTIAGITVLIHDQQCAAEKRRDRKRGILPTPKTKVVIDHRVCEGCGDCGIKSNCLSLEAIDTEFGRKTKIDQASCNLDRSCVKGDCPAFVTVVPGKRKAGKNTGPAFVLPDPKVIVPTVGTTIRMPGIGGTGVVTVSQILLAAAKMEGMAASAVDQTGLSQKAGPVVSTVSLGHPTAGRVEVLIAFDLLAALTSANVDGLDAQWSHVVASTAVTPTGRMIGNVASSVLDISPYRTEFDSRSDPSTNKYVNASALTIGLLGSAVTANVFLMGVAVQAGVIPISPASIRKAIEVNGTAVDANLRSFEWGRRWVVEPAVVEAEARGNDHASVDRNGLDEFGAGELLETVAIRRAELRAYQSNAYAARYVELVKRCHAAERAEGSDGTFTATVAHQLHRVMAYKDEYEVARLLLDGESRAESALGGPVESMTWNLHPPMLRSLGMDSKLKLGAWFRPALSSLKGMKRLRGTALDPFGRAEVRKAERKLIEDYVALVERLLPTLGTDAQRAARLAGLVDQVRGYEGVKMRNLRAYEAALASQV